MVIFHCPLEQRTCTSVYVDKYSAPSRSHLNDLAAWLRAFPDRDVLQRLLGRVLIKSSPIKCPHQSATELPRGSEMTLWTAKATSKHSDCFYFLGPV